MNNLTAKLIYDLFAGKTTNLDEIRKRCGLSVNEVVNAVKSLRSLGIVDSDGLWNAPITFKEKE
jgi:predicted transcriptional regulator